MNIDEIKNLLNDEKVHQLILKCRVEYIAAFGPDISGHSFHPSDDINLLVEGKKTGLLEFAHFRYNILRATDCYDIQTYTTEALKNMASSRHISQEFYDNAIQYSKVVYTNAGDEEKRGQMSLK